MIRMIGMYMMITILLCSCSNNGTDQSATLNPPSPKGSFTKDKTFGIIYPMTYPTYELVTLDANEAAASHNVALIVNAPDEANTEQQIRIMESMIKQGIDGIAISPVDSAALAPVINKAETAGIPVVTFESDAPGSKRTAYIGADNFLTGRQSAITVSRLLGNKGMIIVENGMEEMLGMKQRLEGFLDYLNQESSIDVLEVHHNKGSEEQAMSDIESMIDAHPHFDAMVGLDYISASASTLIWKAKGLNRLAVSMGITATNHDALLNGQLAAVISQNEAAWGQSIVETLVRASNGEHVDSIVNMGITELNSALMK
ncbi:ribose transport system substrate-binding protein [Paenibacillus catalpae]|uniref:Ribose transport system substrate-binding protein n=1 Tax=Paenibacillus catalpae TaxID=1045775 RepID=A0A1I1U4W0_9BACL|nr:substrate-binding domain-containing protein [Paenibacillus catalpae]SFD65809.1 ribose transport system substrate-binding protein [Paenibacillus catalpae]